MSQDPLDTNVADIDISYPIIPAGLYQLDIKSAKKEPSKKGGENLVIQFATKEPIQSVKGDMVPTGFVLLQNVSLTPTEKYSAVDIGKRIAAITQSAGFTVADGLTPRAVINDPNRIVGRVVTAKVQISKERTNPETGTIYPERSEIASFVVKR